MDSVEAAKWSGRMEARVESLERLVQIQTTAITALAETAKVLMETVEAVAGMITAKQGDRA